HDRPTGTKGGRPLPRGGGMFLRIERLRLKSGSDAELAAFYRDEALPIFARTPGCRFAALLAPWHASEHLALTSWENAERSRAYERSALYQFVLGRIAPLLDLALEDKVHVDPDTVLTVDPNDTCGALAANLPTLGFLLEDDATLEALGDDGRARFVRVTEIRVDASRVDPFCAAYEDEVAPALAAQEGCSGALLALRLDHPTEMRSMSFWDKEESSFRYELGGESQRLTERVSALLSPVYDWRLTPTDAVPPVLSGGTPLGRRPLEVTSYVRVAACAYAAPPPGAT
ncbi:MAG: antibiotic biosynthesis monooxygenase family protein, partial [Myxococcota bacterium]